MVGIEGIVVGMVGIEGIVVGMVGSGIEGNGGSVTFGAVGKVGSVGFGRVGCVGRVGIGMEGNGGSVGSVGSVGNGVDGSGGKVDLGREGIEGNGGKVAVGRVGIVGRDNAGGGAAGVSNSWRAASLISKPCKHNATSKGNRKQCLQGTAIVLQRNNKHKAITFEDYNCIMYMEKLCLSLSYET
ncbi:hypothetical protein Dsin_015892 [Dipteronia sinensis]|uniref:Uncharacterized protein n=1 Tax=Dipteronia sinensis TaxID=43782 RepID=A0AAE0ACN1_9ROSI|nr:hypothetical protein Dsin_015892 [Dipteronia sinensis]